MDTNTELVVTSESNQQANDGMNPKSKWIKQNEQENEKANKKPMDSGSNEVFYSALESSYSSSSQYDHEVDLHGRNQMEFLIKRLVLNNLQVSEYKNISKLCF